MDNNDIEHLKAQYERPITPKKSKKWRLIVLCLLVLIISAGIVIGGFELSRNKPAHTASAPAVQIAPGPDPRSIIDKIAANQTIIDSQNYTLSRTDATQANASPDTNTIIFKQSNYPYLTNVIADDGLQFTLTDTSGTSNKSAITDAIKKELTAASFTTVTQDTTLLSPYVITSYMNGGTVCQIIDFSNGRLSSLEQSVLCISDASLQASYSNITTLLEKADSSIAPSAKVISQKHVTDGTKKLTTLTVQPNNSNDTTNYYFATLNTDYEYLGKRATPSVDNEASYTLPDDLKKNISDPKWGTFLTDAIQ